MGGNLLKGLAVLGVVLFLAMLVSCVVPRVAVNGELGEKKMKEPSSTLTLTVLNETTAFGEWRIFYPCEHAGVGAGHLRFAHELLENNREGVEKGMEDLFLQDVEAVQIAKEDETLVVRFNLKADYTNGFATGKYKSSYELAEYSPTFVSVLKIVLPQEKRVVSVNPGPNEFKVSEKENELVYFDYNWIYPLEIGYAEKSGAGVPKIGKEWKLPKLPSSADILGGEEEEGFREIPGNDYSRFAGPGLWVGTGTDSVPGTSKTAKGVANEYKPWLYLWSSILDQCPDAVFYRVVKGYDVYAGFDAFLIQYFAYWECQDCVPGHDHDYEPIFVWVKNIGKRPYRVAYDHWDLSNCHTHEIHRNKSYLWSSTSDGVYEVPEGTHTNEKAYYPFGNASYKGDDFGAELILHTLPASLQNNWDVNHVRLGITNCWHTFDTDITGSNCGDYSLAPLNDNELITAYRLELDEIDIIWCLGGIEAFKYDVSNPFEWVFWEDHYHRDHEFPSLSAAINSAVVNGGGEELTVEVSVLYDNTAAGGSSGNALTGLWKDRFSAAVDDELIGSPRSVTETAAGRYTVKFDLCGTSPGTYTLALNVADNLNHNFAVDDETQFLSKTACRLRISTSRLRFLLWVQ